MNYAARKQRVWRGLLLALIPAVLFVPMIVAFTVCPPAYASQGIRITAALFLFVDVWASWKLISVMQRRFDWINGVAVCGMLLVVVVVGALVWGGAANGLHLSQ